MLNLFRSPFLYEEDPGDGQGGDGPEGQAPNGLEELSKKFENFSKTVSKWSNEIGEVRKQGEELQELKEAIGGFGEQFQTLQEMLSSKNNGDSEDSFDPFDENQLIGAFNKVLDQRLKPLEEKTGAYLTQDTLFEMLGKAQQSAEIKNQFKLKDDELKEATEKAQETGIDLETYCWRNYGKRVLGTNLGKDLSNELKNKGDNPPPEPGDDNKLDKKTILDPVDFTKKYRELGADKMKELIRNKHKQET